jgi:hypothetical protein
MKNFLSAVAAVALVFAAADFAAAQTASAKYDPATGVLTVVNGSNIGVIGFDTAAKFKTGVTPGSIGSASPVQYDANTLAYFVATGMTAGTWTIGPVLQTGLTANQINFAYTPLGNETVVAAVEIIGGVIPEPASLALLGIAGAFAGLRRRNG